MTGKHHNILVKAIKENLKKRLIKFQFNNTTDADWIINVWHYQKTLFSNIFKFEFKLLCLFCVCVFNI